MGIPIEWPFVYMKKLFSRWNGVQMIVAPNGKVWISENIPQFIIRNTVIRYRWTRSKIQNLVLKPPTHIVGPRQRCNKTFWPIFNIKTNNIFPFCMQLKKYKAASSHFVKICTYSNSKFHIFSRSGHDQLVIRKLFINCHCRSVNSYAGIAMNHNPLVRI